jgi:hypothetical protein
MLPKLKARLVIDKYRIKAINAKNITVAKANTGLTIKSPMKSKNSKIESEKIVVALPIKSKVKAFTPVVSE